MTADRTSTYRASPRRRPQTRPSRAAARCATALALGLSLGLAPHPAASVALAQSQPSSQTQTQSAAETGERGRQGADPAAGRAFPDARERAARDWDAMTESVSAFWTDASKTLGPAFAWLDGGIAAALAAGALGAYLGGYLGARRRARAADRQAQPALAAPPRGLTVPAAPRAFDDDTAFPPGRREPLLADDRADAPALAQKPASQRAKAESAAPNRSLREAFNGGTEVDQALRPTHGPLSDDVRARLEEADRLFNFFGERFGLQEETAEAAIAYLTRLGSVVESQRNELDDARKQLERLRRGGAGAAEDAAWDLVAEAGRAIRGAGQALRGDPDFADFVREARLEDALRRLAALRAARIERGEPVRADLAEQEWPHDLFRAEALAAAYYPTYREWRDLRFGLTLAAACLRHLLRREGVFVGYVRLLSPMAQGEGEVWSENARGLRELAPVRRAVQATAASGAEAFVVDCETFGYFDAERDLPVRSRLIVYDRAEWR